MSRFLPLGFLVLFTALVFARDGIHRRRTGRSGIFLLARAAHGHRARALAGLAVIGVFWIEAVLIVLGRLEMADAPLALACGALLAFGGTLLMFSAQLALGDSWRVGIESGVCPGLVVRGWYRHSRNPIFLFLFAAFLVFALLVANALTWVLLAGVALGVRKQVLEEERWLSATYGEEYRAYASRVGRFVPGIGRLC